MRSIRVTLLLLFSASATASAPSSPTLSPISIESKYHNRALHLQTMFDNDNQYNAFHSIICI